MIATMLMLLVITQKTKNHNLSYAIQPVGHRVHLPVPGPADDLDEEDDEEYQCTTEIVSLNFLI